MDQKLLLKEKDYELLQNKRIILAKHSFNDPLINPPKVKNKRGKVGKGLKQSKPSKDLANNILDKRISKQPKAMAPAQLRMGIQEEYDDKVEATPWSSILNLFINSYDKGRYSLSQQVANPFGSQGIKADQSGQSSMLSPSSKLAPKQTRSTITMDSYIKIIQNMKKDMKIKWSQNDKVGSLQIAIQSCKLLHDTSNAKFHALKFAYVMEIIEEFGLSVFKRIKILSFPNYSEERIEELSIKELEGTNVPESAQQICRNWLLKISSIRELIPRTIIETTLLRLYFFLDNGVKAKKVLYRLSRANRNFGQYINCIFFCTFLIRIGRQVLPLDKDYILDILDDVFFYIKQGKSRFCRQDVSFDEFFVILEPFFISSFQSLAQNLQKDKFRRFVRILPQNPHPVILKNFIQSFSSSLLITYALDIIKMLQKTQGENKYPIYKILFQRLSGMHFSQCAEFVVLAWTDISQINDIEILLDLLGPFSTIIFKNFPRYEKNRFYSQILEKFSILFENVKLNPSIFNAFNSFLTSILQTTQDISDILALEPFLHAITYFPTASKMEVSCNIVQAFLNRGEDKINDAVVVHLIMGLMKSVPDDKISKLAMNFLQKIDFGKDLQQTLSFYGQMRASFGSIEKVTVNLIYKAAGLTYKARTLNKGRITNKLISFLQATISFCYITVPVLENAHLKLKLYLYLSEVALTNNLISQANSLIKTCITQLSQVSCESDQQLFDMFYRIICFMIVMPDDPQNEYLFLFNGLLHSFQKGQFKTNYEHVLKLQFYTKCIVYLSCQAQQRLPFHLDGVISNDALFKSIDFRVALVERIMQMAELIEEEIGKVLLINGDLPLDSYIVTHMSQCVMTLLTTFEEGERLTKIVKKLVKIIEKSKDKVFAKEQKGMQGPIRTCLAGLNKKLLENELNIKIQL